MQAFFKSKSFLNSYYSLIEPRYTLVFYYCLMGRSLHLPLMIHVRSNQVFMELRCYVVTYKSNIAPRFLLFLWLI